MQLCVWYVCLSPSLSHTAMEKGFHYSGGTATNWSSRSEWISSSFAGSGTQRAPNSSHVMWLWRWSIPSLRNGSRCWQSSNISLTPPVFGEFLGDRLIVQLTAVGLKLPNGNFEKKWIQVAFKAGLMLKRLTKCMVMHWSHFRISCPDQRSKTWVDLVWTLWWLELLQCSMTWPCWLPKMIVRAKNCHSQQISWQSCQLARSSRKTWSAIGKTPHCPLWNMPVPGWWFGMLFYVASIWFPRSAVSAHACTPYS